MVAYNFQAQFAGAVESGAKRQTIRPRRKRATRQGDALQLYTGMRTKACRKLREAACLSVVPVTIESHKHHLVVRVSGRRLNQRELDQFVRADGFRRRMDMRDFFETAYGLPFNGEVITW